MALDTYERASEAAPSTPGRLWDPILRLPSDRERSGASRRRRRFASAGVPLCGAAVLAALAAVLLGHGESLFYTPLAVMVCCAVGGWVEAAPPNVEGMLTENRLSWARSTLNTHP